jgi:hypothetical protein
MKQKAKKASKKAHSKSRKAPARPSKSPNKFMSRIRKTKIKEKAMFELSHYPQSDEFTSSAASAMMVLKFLNQDFKFRRESEYTIWQESVNGSVWHGSKYGLAYALAKRGARIGILSNTKGEGYDRKMAVYENVNLDTLTSSFNEIRQKALEMGVEEEHGPVTIQMIKKALSANALPIVLIDANIINSYLESSPHWVVVKGYDKDAFYINDPYSDSTITIDHNAFKAAIGFDTDMHMILADAKFFDAKKAKESKQ